MPASPHSTCSPIPSHSDGALPPAEVVERAAAAGVELFALTDHDTVDGVARGGRAARASSACATPRRRALGRSTAATRTCTSSATSSTSPTPTLLATLEDFRGDRARRIDAMADRLRELGFELDDAPLVARREAGKPIGRPHLADARARAPGQRERLATRASTARTSCSRPTSCPGAQAYVARSRPTVARGDRGHPRRRRRRRLGAPVLGRRRARGGARARSTSSPTPGSTASSASTSPTPRSRPGCCTSSRAALGLLTTGSTDFHGPDHGRFSAFRGFEVHGLTVELGPIGGNSG